MTVKLEVYKLDVVNEEFDKVDVITSYSNLSWFSKKNGTGAARFDMDIYDPKLSSTLITKYNTVIAVKVNQTILWVGYVDNVSGSQSGATGKISIEVKEQFKRLEDRYTSERDNYLAVDQGVILKSLVDDAQVDTSAFLGLTIPSVPATKTRDRLYTYANVYQAFNDLVNVIDGLDYSFDVSQDADKNLSGVTINLVDGIGRQRDDLPTLQLGYNCGDYRFISKTDIFNRITGISNMQIISVSNNSDSQAAIGLRSDVRKFYDIKLKSTLDERVAYELNDSLSEKIEFELILNPAVYQYNTIVIGDTLPIDIVNNYKSLTGYAEVKEIASEVDEQGVIFEKIKLLKTIES